MNIGKHLLLKVSFFTILCVLIASTISCNKGNSAPTTEDYISRISHRDVAIRRQAAASLARMPQLPKDAMLPLMNVVVNDTDSQTRAFAVQALGVMKGAAKDAVPSMIEALTANDTELQIATLKALAQIGPKAKEALPQVLIAASDVRWITEATTWMQERLPKYRQVSFATNVENFLEIARAKHFAAIDTLAKIAPSSKKTIETLTSFLDYPLPKTRITAAIALAQIGERADSAGAGLIRCLADEHNDVRRYAAWAIGKINIPSADRKLIELLKDSSEEVRHNSATALQTLGTRRALSALDSRTQELLPHLHSRDWDTRRNAARELAVLGTPKAVDALKEHKRFFPNTVIEFENLS